MLRALVRSLMHASAQKGDGDKALEQALENKKEAIRTYIEQTKLLVTLASAFLLAPAGLVAVFKERASVGITTAEAIAFVVAEGAFVASVLIGYVVMGTIAGSQDDGSFDVYRPATRWFSLAQFGLYLAGLIVFIVLGVVLATAHPSDSGSGGGKSTPAAVSGAPPKTPGH